MKEKNIKTKEPIMINAANTGNSGTMQKEKFDKVNRQEKIESYIERLSKGESLEAVRKDFVENFKDVSVHEIVHVEQNIIKKGTPLSKVQRLCDVHSALFHGRTEAEIYKEEEQNNVPIYIMKLENKEIQKRIKQLEKINNELLTRFGQLSEEMMIEIRKKRDNKENDTAEITTIKSLIEILKNMLSELKNIGKHYGKKEELFFPKLCEYGYKGPSDVMWGVDDEIKGDISFLYKFIDIDNFLHYKNNLKRLIDRIKEMIYKEEKILFPLALNNFTKDDWKEVYADYDEMRYAFINDIPRWKDAACWIESKEGAVSSESIADAIGNGIIKMPTGELMIKQLVAMFAIIPIDFTFIDKDDILRFFTNNEKVFARPLSALGRKIYTCHPPRIIPVVEAMLGDFKTKCNDKMEMWIDKPDNPVKVIYHAVYDDKGEYIGTLEMVQSFKDAKEHFASK